MSGTTNTSGNPYLIYGDEMLSKIYPPMPAGYKGRTTGLMVLIIYTMVMAVTYLFIANWRMRARADGPGLWFFRLVKRPQGRYLLLNQTIIYPIGVLVNSIVYLIFIMFSRGWWIDHHLATTAFYWIQLKDLPPFFLNFLTTFAVLASSNILSNRRNQLGTHILGPNLMNSVGIVLLPLALLAMFVTASRAGGAWAHVFSIWEGLWEHTEEQGAAFTDFGLTEDQIQAQVAQLRRLASRTLGANYFQFVYYQRVAFITAVVGVSTLLVVNVVGAFVLVSQLRMTPKRQLISRNAPIVSPLGPLATPNPDNPSSSGFFSNALSRSTTRLGDMNKSQEKLASPAETISEWYEVPDESGKPEKAHRLDWQITLFYFNVVPACIIFLVEASWILSQPTSVFRHGLSIEVASFTVAWGSSILAAVSLTAQVVKLLYRWSTKPEMLSPPPYDPTDRRKRSSSRSPRETIIIEKEASE